MFKWLFNQKPKLEIPEFRIRAFWRRNGDVFYQVERYYFRDTMRFYYDPMFHGKNFDSIVEAYAAWTNWYASQVINSQTVKQWDSKDFENENKPF